MTEKSAMREDAPILKGRRTKIINGRRKWYSHFIWHKNTGHWPEWPEVIHHKDFDVQNDAFENLQLMDAAEHAFLHNNGVTRTEEHRAKTSAAAIERWKDPEYRAKISAANMGDNNPSWKGDNIGPRTEYNRIWRARRRAEQI